MTALRFSLAVNSRRLGTAFQAHEEALRSPFSPSRTDPGFAEGLSGSQDRVFQGILDILQRPFDIDG